MKPNQDPATGNTGHDERIDAALRAYSAATPVPGLESRVAARLAFAPDQSPLPRRFAFGNVRRLLLVRRLSAGALVAASAWAIVFATVQHSHRVVLPQAARAPQAGGISAAQGMHLPTRAMPQAATVNPQAPRTPPRSRSTVPHSSGHDANPATTPNASGTSSSEKPQQ